MGFLDSLSRLWSSAAPAPVAVVPSAAVVNADELRRIMPYAGGRVGVYLAPLNAAMVEFEITTNQRIAAFLAQVAHESGELKYVEEIASGDAYDTRTDLGNTPEIDGDGRKFKGRGLIQVTGRTNYYLCSFALFDDGRLLDDPELLEQPVNACRSAGWFWKTHGLNLLADRDDFAGITKRVNGGLKTLAQREVYWDRAKVALA